LPAEPGGEGGNTSNLVELLLHKVVMLPLWTAQTAIITGKSFS
jgi:hypothetical protein